MRKFITAKCPNYCKIDLLKKIFDNEIFPDTVTAKLFSRERTKPLPTAKVNSKYFAVCGIFHTAKV